MRIVPGLMRTHVFEFEAPAATGTHHRQSCQGFAGEWMAPYGPARPDRMLTPGDAIVIKDPLRRSCWNALAWLALATLGLTAPALADQRAGGPARAAEIQRAPGPALEASIAVPDSAAAETTAAAPAPSPRDYIAEVRANFTAENRAYSGTRTVLDFVAPLYGLLVSLIILFSGLAAKMRDVAHDLGQRLYVRVLVFLFLYTIADFVLGFPLTWYQGYALEHQYGLSTQSFGAWFAEQGKSAAVGIVFFGVVPILALAYRAIRRWPRHWWLPMALGTLPLIVAGALIQPPIIDPLYNKFTPLRDQHLKARILELAARAEIPGRRVYEVNKSAQTVKYNAYVNGFGASQRIVLWDTTLKGMKEDEILFVVGHEMGHYKLNHIWKGIVVFSLFSLLLFFLGSRITAWAVRRFGPRWGFSELSDVASMPLLSATFVLLSLVAQPVTNGFARRIEHEADVFAVELTRDNDAGARAFLKLGSQNRSNPEPMTWVKLFQYTHPPLLERIRFVLDYRPWEQGKPNRFYRGAPAAP
jgi:Zn-dependent protease with chaperone function